MAILIECPKCRKRNSLKKVECGCGKNIRKASSKNYWIEYYIGGKRKRERIGQSKQAAENRLREIETAKAEGRYIRKNKNAEVNLIELREWYLDLAEVKQKRSYHDIRLCINNFINRIGSIPVSQLTPELIEKFRKLRLTEISKTKKRPVKPSTINRDIANLRAMLNKAVDYSKLELNPLGRIKQLEENNVRERVLNPEEFNLLLQHCPEHLKGPVLIAFYLPMRQAEILKLTWDQNDFKSEFI